MTKLKLVPPSALCDEVLCLRPVDERDLAMLERAAHDPDVVSAFGRSTSAGEELAFHRRRWEDGTAAAFAICPAGAESVGVVLLEPREARRADIGFWILAENRRRGYATRATRLVAVWALRNLGFARVQLWSAPENEASQRVAERSGFQREGVLRAYGEAADGRRVDAVFFSLIPGDL